METVLAWVVLILIVYIIKIKKDNKFKTSDNINMIQAPPTLSSLYDKKIYLLTSDELKFYKLLKPIVNRNELNLFTQVALYEIVKAKDIKDFNKIKSKSIDFVITDLNCKIKICIELGDASHLKDSRQKRDIFIETLFNDLGIKLLRIPVQSYYDLTTLEAKIKELL
ncbi:MAG: DUF2726 domain-containing protein [Clostridia bacterium]